MATIKCNIVARGSCLHSMKHAPLLLSCLYGWNPMRTCSSQQSKSALHILPQSFLWFLAGMPRPDTFSHNYTSMAYKNAGRASRIASTASSTGVINLNFFNMSSTVAFCHRDTSTSSPDSCFPCRASFNFVPSLQVAHWSSSSNRQTAFSTIHCRLYGGSRTLVRLMKFSCVWHKQVSRGVLRLRSTLTERAETNVLAMFLPGSRLGLGSRLVGGKVGIGAWRERPDWGWAASITASACSIWDGYD